MQTTHKFNGYGCVANLKSLSTGPEVKNFNEEEVQFIAEKGYDVLFFKDDTIWITDEENWRQNSQKIV